MSQGEPILAPERSLLIKTLYEKRFTDLGIPPVALASTAGTRPILFVSITAELMNNSFISKIRNLIFNTFLIVDLFVMVVLCLIVLRSFQVSVVTQSMYAESA